MLSLAPGRAPQPGRGIAWMIESDLFNSSCKGKALLMCTHTRRTEATTRAPILINLARSGWAKPRTIALIIHEGRCSVRLAA